MRKRENSLIRNLLVETNLDRKQTEKNNMDWAWSQTEKKLYFVLKPEKIKFSL